MTYVFKYALLVAPLLAGCPGGGPPTGMIGLPPGGLTLPDCSEGQLLVTGADNRLTCGTAPRGPITLPGSCADNQALNSDGTTVSCVNKATGGTTNPLNTKITELTTRTDNLITKVTNLQGGSGVATWVGNSTKTSNGNLMNLDATADNSLAAAAKTCSAEFGTGAHMCNTIEIYESAARGVIGSAKNIAKAWVHVANWQNPVAGSFNPTFGYGDNCGSYTYPTGDKNWKGTAIQTGNNEQTGRWSLKFIGGADTSCATALPVACCK